MYRSVREGGVEVVPARLAGYLFFGTEVDGLERRRLRAQQFVT